MSFHICRAQRSQLDLVQHNFRNHADAAHAVEQIQQLLHDPLAVARLTRDATRVRVTTVVLAIYQLVQAFQHDGVAR